MSGHCMKSLARDGDNAARPPRRARLVSELALELEVALVILPVPGATGSTDVEAAGVKGVVGFNDTACSLTRRTYRAASACSVIVHRYPSDRVELLDLCTSAGFGAAGRRRVQRSDHALQSCSSAV